MPRIHILTGFIRHSNYKTNCDLSLQTIKNVASYGSVMVVKRGRVENPAFGWPENPLVAVAPLFSDSQPHRFQIRRFGATDGEIRRLRDSMPMQNFPLRGTFSLEDLFFLVNRVHRQAGGEQQHGFFRAGFLV
jgi:hypothetical protein